VADKIAVFISHIGEEAALAHSLKSWIESTFPDSQCLSAAISSVSKRATSGTTKSWTPFARRVFSSLFAAQPRSRGLGLRGNGERRLYGRGSTHRQHQLWCHKDMPIVSGHGDCFTPGKLAAWAPYLIERVKAHLAMVPRRAA